MIKKYKYSRGGGLDRVNRSGPDQNVRGKEYGGFAILPMLQRLVILMVQSGVKVI